MSGAGQLALRSTTKHRPLEPAALLTVVITNDTNICMNSPTRERLLTAASRLFAEHGFRGASVRDICNHAGANPGAVSYHFGGKRQLYRAVLRRATARLADLTPRGREIADDATPPTVLDVLDRLFARMENDRTASQLLLRDLADGGAVAVESLAPPLRTALEALAHSLGYGDSPQGGREVRLLFLELAAPLFLLGTAWPVIAQVLELPTDERRSLLEEMMRRTLEARGLNTQG